MAGVSDYPARRTLERTLSGRNPASSHELPRTNATGQCNEPTELIRAGTPQPQTSSENGENAQDDGPGKTCPKGQSAGRRIGVGMEKMVQQMGEV